VAEALISAELWGRCSPRLATPFPTLVGEGERSDVTGRCAPARRGRFKPSARAFQACSPVGSTSIPLPAADARGYASER